MAKKLNLKVMKKVVKHLDEKKKVVVDVDDKGEEVVVYIYPNFSNTRIDNFVKDMFSSEQEALKKGIDFSKINRGNWFFFNLIKHFSDLENDIPNDIKQKIQYYLILVETPYFPKIVDAFPKESILKLQDAVAALVKQVEALTDKQMLDIEKQISDIDKQIEQLDDVSTDGE